MSSITSNSEPDQNYFIAGDWGTSNLRLYLCQHNRQGSARLIEQKSGDGIKHCDQNFETVLLNHIQQWRDQYGNLPVILSGMVGSNIGWKTVDYLEQDFSITAIANSGIEFSVDGLKVHILSGLKTQNMLGATDVMRGEEIQLLGFMSQEHTSSSRECISLPGTHNKWVLINNHQIETFLTSFTGELYQLIYQNSILAKTADSNVFSEPAFLQALAYVKNSGNVDLVHRLFSTRSLQLDNTLSAQNASSYLSGLIIGSDIMQFHRSFSANISADIHFIGDASLVEKYKLACNFFDINTQNHCATDIALRAYNTIYQQRLG